MYFLNQCRCEVLETEIFSHVLSFTRPTSDIITMLLYDSVIAFMVMEFQCYRLGRAVEIEAKNRGE